MMCEIKGVGFDNNERFPKFGGGFARQCHSTRRIGMVLQPDIKTENENVMRDFLAMLENGVPRVDAIGKKRPHASRWIWWC